MLAGTLLGVLLRRHLRERGSAWRFAAQMLGYAAALAAAGLLLHTLHDLHPAFRVSKIHATLPWGLLSSALTCAAWVLVFVLVDVLAWRRWPRSFTIAGENPLVAYLMAPFLLSLFALLTPLFGGHELSTRPSARRPASASSARRSSPGSSCASAAGCGRRACASSCSPRHSEELPVRRATRNPPRLRIPRRSPGTKLLGMTGCANGALASCQWYDAGIMRTTLAITDDALELARKLARQKQVSLGEDGAQLVRRGLGCRCRRRSARA